MPLTRCRRCRCCHLTIVRPQGPRVKLWLQEAFDAVFLSRRYGDMGNGNGPGSTLEATAQIRPLLRDLILRLNATSLIDLGCGAMSWQPALLQASDPHALPLHGIIKLAAQQGLGALAVGLQAWAHSAAGAAAL